MPSRHNRTRGAALLWALLGLCAPSAVAQAQGAQSAGAAPAKTTRLASSELALPARDAAGRVAYDFVADAVREAGEADVALVDLSRLQGSLGRGTISAATLHALMPWDAALVRYELSGGELAALLTRPAARANDVVRSGITAAPADPTAVRELRIQGRALRPEQRYRVVVLEGSALLFGARAQRLPVSLHGSVQRYLTTHPFLRATPQGRVIAAELPAAVQCREQLQPR